MPTTKEISDKFYIVAKNQHDEIYKDAEHPENFSFPTSMEFFQNLKQEISKQYINYPPELHEDIRKSLWRQLSKDSKNISNTNIFSQSGTLNTTYLKNTTQTTINKLKTDFPEKFAKIENNLNEINSQQLSSEQIRQSDKDILSKIFEEYSKFETFEEKIKYFNENILDISSLSNKEQKEFLSKYEKAFLFQQRQENEITDTMTDDEIKSKIEKIAKELEIEKKDIEIYNNLSNAIKDANLNEALKYSNKLEIIDKDKIKDQIKHEQENKNKIEDNSKSTTLYNYVLNNSLENDTEIDNLLSNSSEIDLNLDELLSDNFEIELESEDLDLSSIIDNSVEENNLTNNVLEETQISQKNIENKTIINNKHINPILTGAEDKDFETNKNSDTLSQKDYVINIEEKETIWTKIKNKFNDIKNAIVKKLNLNSNNKKLSSQKYIDTAENNTHNIEDSVSKFEESIKTFNDSIKVSNEVINNTNSIAKQSKQDSNTKSDTIRTSNATELSL